jgi:hypothetical protein
MAERVAKITAYRYSFWQKPKNTLHSPIALAMEGAVADLSGDRKGDGATVG